MHKIEYVLVKILLFVFSRLSIRTGKKIASVVVFIVAHVVRYRRKIILQNLHRVYGNDLPEPEKIFLKKIYRHFVYLWMEFLQNNRLQKDTMDGHFRFYNFDLLTKALKKGKGAILVSAHMGNFEWLGQVVGLKGIPVSGIAKRQSNPYVNDLIEKNRRQFGVGVIYTRQAIPQAVAALQKNEVIGIVADQDARSHGIFVDFLGQPSSTAVGPVIMHLRSGAALLFAITIRRDYGHFDFYFQEIAGQTVLEINDENIRALTQRHVHILEEWVRRYPEQWFWMHRRWKSKPADTQ